MSSGDTNPDALRAALVRDLLAKCAAEIAKVIVPGVEVTYQCGGQTWLHGIVEAPPRLQLHLEVWADPDDPAYEVDEVRPLAFDQVSEVGPTYPQSQEKKS